MHRCSESIAALAAALAKAQTELSNPEKSLVATIGADRLGEGARTFRYAPLSSGLDIVRKALGQQQIATVQTTAIEPSTGTVNLTTVLAHASGEWISSDWPVCRLADTASPQRMGAALTYARRYALFTLVGIAGEDDLDAPDLDRHPEPEESARASPVGAVVPLPDKRRGPGNGKDRARPPLDPDTSAALRDDLVREAARLGSPAEAADWAQAALPAKNTLTAPDARIVELAFDLRLFAFEAEQAAPKTGPGAPETAERVELASDPSSSGVGVVAPGRGQGKRAPGRSTKRPGIDKSVLAIGEPRRYRNKAHIQFVAAQSCLICGRRPSDPHHLRFAQKRALGRKVSDEFTVPLCRLHHRELHRSRDERAWWSRTGVDPVKIARTLWKKTRCPESAPLESQARIPVTSAVPTDAPTSSVAGAIGGPAANENAP
jgi:hypothetical protein